MKTVHRGRRTIQRSRAGPRSAYCDGKWNDPGCSRRSRDDFPFGLAVRLSIGARSIRLDRVPSCRLWSLSLRAALVAQRSRREDAGDDAEGAAPGILLSVATAVARSRAVNFELVRDATAYVCPECGTKCARDRIKRGAYQGPAVASNRPILFRLVALARFRLVYDHPTTVRPGRHLILPKGETGCLRARTCVHLCSRLRG